MDKRAIIHKPAHRTGFHPHRVDHVDKFAESMRFRAALPVKLLMVTGQIASSRYPRAYYFNILF